MYLVIKNSNNNIDHYKITDLISKNTDHEEKVNFWLDYIKDIDEDLTKKVKELQEKSWNEIIENYVEDKFGYTVVNNLSDINWQKESERDYDKEKTKEDVFRRWNSYKGAQLDTYNYKKYRIYKHKNFTRPLSWQEETNDKFSLYILVDDYHGCDLEFAYFDKKNNLIFKTNDEIKCGFFEKYLIDPNINQDKFDQYKEQILDYEFKEPRGFTR